MRYLKLFAFFILLLFSLNAFSSSVKKKKSNQKPQKDYYHQNFDEMDQYLEKALDKDSTEDGNFKRRKKKS